MCVIIEKTLGQEIPFEALQRASTRNPHGFGVLVADRGELVATRGVCEKPERAAEEVAKTLEQLKDLPTLIHFRYATAGNKTLANAHPFELLKLDTDGIDLQLMHNGTMSQFKDPNKSESDTSIFCSLVAQPLLQRWWAYADSEDEMMVDPALKRTLEAIVGSGVLTLMTGTGKVMKINEDYGATYPWGWASNTNTLVEDKSKRNTSKSSRYGSLAEHSASTLETAATEMSNSSAWSPPEHWKSQYPLSAQNKATRSLDDQGAALRDMLRLSPNTTVTLPIPRTRLDAKDFLGTFELEDLIWLDLDDVRDLIKKCPEATAVILMDLLFKMYLDEKGKPIVSYGKGVANVDTN